MIYTWRISSGLGHVVLRAPTAADALAMFDVNIRLEVDERMQKILDAAKNEGAPISKGHYGKELDQLDHDQVPFRIEVVET